MPHRLRITASALKDIERLPARTAERVRGACRDLAGDPRPSGAAILRGGDVYRIRIGDYGVLYDVDDAERIVTVLRVRHRRDAYRDL